MAVIDGSLSLRDLISHFFGELILTQPKKNLLKYPTDIYLINKH